MFNFYSHYIVHKSFPNEMLEDSMVEFFFDTKVFLKIFKTQMKVEDPTVDNKVKFYFFVFINLGT